MEGYSNKQKQCALEQAIRPSVEDADTDKPSISIEDSNANEIEKQWVTVAAHKGHEIQTLSGAGALDCLDYKVRPPLPGQSAYCNCPTCTFATVGDAINGIDFFTDRG